MNKFLATIAVGSLMAIAVPGVASASGGGHGVSYVPPGGAAVAPLDRGLVQGYFGSFARIDASGW